MKIGIVDSGLGGFSSFPDFLEKNFFLEYFYFADNLNFPYNSKEETFLLERINKIITFLEKIGCEKIFMACNSVSVLLKKYPFSVDSKLIFVTENIYENILKIENENLTTIIGTQHTINSNFYQKILAEKRIKHNAIATPFLAEIAEDFLVNKKVNKTLLKREFEKIIISKDQTLILACTHYSFLIKEIFILFPEITIIDSNGVHFKSKKILSEQKKFDFLKQVFCTKKSLSFELGVKKIVKKNVEILNIEL